MSQEQKAKISPAISIAIIVFSLFLTVFLQMEVRRMGYIVWKQSREHKSHLDEHRILAAELARIVRPSRLQEVAVNRLTLTEPKAGQIIHMSGERVAVRQ
jgi:hypothetical protein